jgi:hypothetical protein
MVIPVVMLVVLTLVVMRALMGVVAHDEAAVPAESIMLDKPTLPGTPAPELRARADDGVRSFLMPAAEPVIVAEHDPTADRSHSTS